MALTGLGVTHSADRFHGQYELTGAYSRRLSLRVQAAEKVRTRCPTPATIGQCAPLHARRGHGCPRRVGKSIPQPGTH
jgi:hypothetical protein